MWLRYTRDDEIALRNFKAVPFFTFTPDSTMGSSSED